MHRISYWKTIALSLFGALTCLGAWALISVFGPTAARLPLAFLFVTCLVVLSAIVAGGLVCLRRDSLEAEGKKDFLADFATRPPPRHPVLNRLRQLLGGTGLRPGDLVRVRDLSEIRATLDSLGTTAGLPFMREMEPLCGQEFRVHRRVDHINDMRNKTGLRKIRAVVTLTDVRCPGSAHDGCEAECQILWKDVWLCRLREPPSTAVNAEKRVPPALSFRQRESTPEHTDRIYFCQMTALWGASEPFPQLDLFRDLRPLTSGNMGLRDYLQAILTRIFNFAQDLRGGVGYPYMPDPRLKGPTPSSEFHFESGDDVVVRTKEEIAHTLVDGKNRGLWFDRDMIRYCCQPGVVRKRVTRVIHEASGKMIEMKTPCLQLEGVIASGEFLRLCAQHEYIFWREAWLAPAATKQRAGLALND